MIYYFVKTILTQIIQASLLDNVSESIKNC
ncbi:hypothetical protein C8J95_1042 [Elizabethkingia sp. YR214]|nr:hypothetical protein C8J95_1042 [Elizabethkingia sp. YR214]